MFIITFVLEHVMGIIWDSTKDDICVSGVAFVNFLVFHVKPVVVMAEDFIKIKKKTRLESYSLVIM